MGTQLPLKWAQPPVLAHVYRGQTAGWMKMPLGTEVDLSPGQSVLDGDPAHPPREGGTAAPRLFSAHVFCGHGRPPQLLLSSCYILNALVSRWLFLVNYQIKSMHVVQPEMSDYLPELQSGCMIVD